jgi:hypothetical protein
MARPRRHDRWQTHRRAWSTQHIDIVRPFGEGDPRCEHHQGLRFSVLANGASHLHLADDSVQMQDLALTYYSQSMRGLSRVVAAPSPAQDYNATLTAIILLYLHGVSMD